MKEISKETSKETITLPVSQLKTALQIIEQGKLCELEKNSLIKEISVLNKKIDNRDALIQNLDRQNQIRDTIIDYHVRNKVIYEVENNTLKTNIENNTKIYNQQLTRQKKRTRFYKLTTFVAIGTGAYLLLK